MKINHLIFLIVFSLLVNSCSKQKATGVSDPETRNQEEQQRLDACSNVNFNKGVLLYQNVILLFKCTKWDLEFPNMFKSIKNISGESWDQIFSPINEAFLENQTRRDRVFKNIRDLDSKGGLDGLSYVIVALNETNFFDSVKAMFKCVSNPAEEFCHERKNIPLKRSLKNIIHLVDLNPDAIGELSQLLKYITVAMGPHQEEFRTEVNKFRFANNYIPIRLRLVDAIANKVKTGFSNEDRVFVTKLLTTAAANKDVPWIYEWLKDEKLGRLKFRDLLEYPALTNPDFISDVRGIKQMYDLGLNCSIKKDNYSNDLLEFDLKAGIGEYLNILTNKEYKTFFDYSTMHITGLKASTEICKELVENKYNANLIKAATKVAEFLAEKKNYDLMRFVLHFSTVKADPTKTFAENIYFGDFLSQDIFSTLNGLNTHVASNTRDFFPVVYDVLTSLPPEAIINLSNVISEVAKPENDLKFVGVADFWNFFTDEEKNFVFNFVDRHFDKDINFTLLFDFYAKFLDDFEETQPIFRNAWTGTELKDENSYLALQDFFYNLSGKDTLKDFQKFFSRNQILKVLEVLANGQKLVADAKAEIAYRDSTNYVLKTKAEKYKYTVHYDPGSDIGYDAKAVVACMQKFNDIQNGFYELVKNLPEACKAVTQENISFRLFGWLNSIENDFSKFKKPNISKDSLFDDKGFLSPYMLNTNIGLLKISDSILGSLDSKEPTKKGINYLLDSFNYYLNGKAGINELNKDVVLLSSYLDVDADKNVIYRNSILKKYSKDENFSYSRNVISNFSDLIMDFGQWIRDGKYDLAVKRSFGTFDPNTTCEKTINQFVSTNACPSKVAVKEWGNHLLYLLQNTWEPEMGSPIKYLLAGSKMGGSLDIPLNSKKTFKFKLTLADNLKYLFDTFDRNLKVNNLNVHFENAKGNSADVNLTTLERVETVIREVRFGNNYLGATYLNHVVEGDNYVKDVAQRKKLMSTCLKIPSVRCGRPMSDSDLRMAKNALASFDSLLDVDNGRGIEAKLNYGTFLKAFQQTLIASSSKDAQAVTLFPLKDEILKKHNGQLLGDLTMINGYSNAARILKDRVGRSREDFEKFLKREDFKRVDRTLMNGFDLNIATPAAERLVNKLRVKYPSDTQNLFENIVDWSADLTYEESRLVEDTMARLLVVGSYLGTPDVVFNLQSTPKGYERYQSNNLFQIFLAAERLVDYWPTLKSLFPGDAKLINVIKPINTFLYFLTEKLNSSSDPATNKTYVALNDVFYVLQTVLFDSIEDNRIIGNGVATYKGFDFILSGLKDSKLVTNTYNTIRDNYKFSDEFFKNNGQFFQAFGQNLKRMSNNTRVDLNPIKDYLNFTSKNAICIAGDSACVANYHYDEVATLVKYMTKKDDNNVSYLSILNKKIFQENYTQITNLIDDLLPCLKIKSVKIPLAIN